jgi:hypothetical protein
MLRLDRVIVARGANGKESLQRLELQQQKETKRHKKASGAILGNSRCTSSQIMKLRPESTFDKRQHAKEKEEKNLRSIAKLLAGRQSSKKTKS